MCARRRTHFFCFAKRSKQEKATRRLGPLRCATGQPAVLGFGGVSLNSLRSNNAIPDPPNPALLGPASTGWSRAIATLGPQGRARSASSPPGRAKQRPVTTPSVCACGGVFAGWHACRRTRMLRELTRRGCLSAARSA